MKIAFLGNFNVDYSSETHHVKSLESLGHEVIKLQEGKDDSMTIFRAASSSDMFVWIHTHSWETPIPAGFTMVEVLDSLNRMGIPTVTYHLDLWFGLDRQKDLENDEFYKHIGHFFTVDKQMTDWFNENTNVKGHYLQAGVFDQECYMATSLSSGPVNDLIFVGSYNYHSEWPYRKQLIDWLHLMYKTRFKHYGGDGLGVKRGAELNQLYAESKIAIGDTLCIGFDYPYYWSDRVYETLGRGGFIIHPYVKGMEEHFEDKKHLVFYEYGNFKQLEELIEYYLEHPEEREYIRKAGHEHVKANHTYKNRWQYIIDEVTNND